MNGNIVAKHTINMFITGAVFAADHCF